MYEVCMGYVWGMYGVCMGYVRGIPLSKSDKSDKSDILDILDKSDKSDILDKSDKSDSRFFITLFRSHLAPALQYIVMGPEGPAF